MTAVILARARAGTTVVIATHDAGVARLAGTVLQLTRGRLT